MSVDDKQTLLLRVLQLSRAIEVLNLIVSIMRVTLTIVGLRAHSTLRKT